jgi:hypothetical protein
VNPSHTTPSYSLNTTINNIPHLRLGTSSGSFLNDLLPNPLFSHAIIFTDFNPNIMWPAVQIMTAFLNIKLVA